MTQYIAAIREARNETNLLVDISKFSNLLQPTDYTSNLTLIALEVFFFFLNLQTKYAGKGKKIVMFKYNINFLSTDSPVPLLIQTKFKSKYLDLTLIHQAATGV